MAKGKKKATGTKPDKPPKKRKRKLSAAEKAAKRRRRAEYETIFINGKQKRVKRQPTIEGLDIDEFIRQNADPIWLHQNEMWEYIDGFDGDEYLTMEMRQPLTVVANLVCTQVTISHPKGLTEVLFENSGDGRYLCLRGSDGTQDTLVYIETASIPTAGYFNVTEAELHPEYFSLTISSPDRETVEVSFAPELRANPRLSQTLMELIPVLSWAKE